MQQSREQVMKDQTVVHLKDICVSFDGKAVFDHFDISLSRGDRLALCGPSGIGKSTLIRLMAGLLAPQSGSVKRNGSVSVVFDDNKLYPQMSCRENIELGIDWSKSSRNERREESEKWIEAFDCSSFSDQRVSTLSAGQKKRTALARAMMKHPDLLLLDETFHALDPKLKDELIGELLELQRESGFAIVFATHDLREAEKLNARVLYFDPDRGPVLDGGRADGMSVGVREQQRHKTA